MAGFYERLIEIAKKHGFPLAGALDLDYAAIEAHVRRYDEWLHRGYAGAMQYLVRGRDRRADPKLVFPDTKSILCVAWPYSAQPAGAESVAEGPRFSRYLRARDYHKDIAEKLEGVMREVAAEDATLKWKVCVDTSAVLERSWAALAGLGWIGKNTLLIHPQLGSYLFIGTVLINHETGHGPVPLKDYCGNCTRCQDACPTRAFTEPHLLNATRCIGYLTLEKRGALELSEADKRAVGTWAAGCDVCQEVCPFNTKAAKHPLLQEEGAISLKTWRELLEETPEQYRARTRGSALDRVKPPQFSRNLALTLANALLSSEGDARAELLQLRSLIESRLTTEADAAAKVEWQRCLRIVRGEDT